MIPSARMQAAMELLDWIIAAARDNGASADNITKKYFKERR
ncbi:MAG: RsmB/NOP family class I SAM-dependent RNA methyltransferase, partial [Parasphingorhabdus sp.]